RERLQLTAFPIRIHSKFTSSDKIYNPDYILSFLIIIHPPPRYTLFPYTTALPISPWHFGQCRLRQELYAISVWPHAGFSQRATCPPSAAVRQRSIALMTFSWSRLICPLLASRQAGP